MIVFNHNIVFKSEERLQDDMFNDTLETIHVIKKSDFLLRKNFSLVSDWHLMSGQQMRYYSGKSFEQADRSLSWALEVKDVLTLV